MCGKCKDKPLMTDEQRALVHWDLWCIVRLANNREVKVYNFDGFEFRNNVDVGAIGGVNGVRDPYLPCDEIGIERMMNPEDEPAFLLHEMEEMVRMERGVSYDEAHHTANGKESQYRQEQHACPSPHITD
jgi:hypothetical protein